MKKILVFPLSMMLTIFAAHSSFGAESGVSVKSSRSTPRSMQSPNAYSSSQQKWTTNRQARVHAYRDGEEAERLQAKESTTDPRTNTQQVTESRYVRDSVGARQRLVGNATYEESNIPQVTMPYIASDRRGEQLNDELNDERSQSRALQDADELGHYRPTVQTRTDRSKKIDVYRALDPYTLNGEFYEENISQASGARKHLYVRGSNYEGRLGAYDGVKIHVDEKTNRWVSEENILFNDSPRINEEYQLLYPQFIDVLDISVQAHIGTDVPRDEFSQRVNPQEFVPVDGSLNGTGGSFITATKNIYSLGTSAMQMQSFPNSNYSSNAETTLQNQTLNGRNRVIPPNTLAYVGGILTNADRASASERDNIASAIRVDNHEIVPYRVASASRYDQNPNSNGDFKPLPGSDIDSASIIDWYAILGAWRGTEISRGGYGSIIQKRKNLDLDETSPVFLRSSRDSSSLARVSGQITNQKIQDLGLQVVDLAAFPRIRDEMPDQAVLFIANDNNLYTYVMGDDFPTLLFSFESLRLDREERQLGEYMDRLSLDFWDGTNTYIALVHTNKNRLFRILIGTTGRNRLQRIGEFTSIDENVHHFCTNYNWYMYSTGSSLAGISENREFDVRVVAQTSTFRDNRTRIDHGYNDSLLTSFLTIASANNKQRPRVSVPEMRFELTETLAFHAHGEDNLPPLRIFDLACGSTHGLILAGSRQLSDRDNIDPWGRRVYGFGSNSHFQLASNLGFPKCMNDSPANQICEWTRASQNDKDPTKGFVPVKGQIVYYNGSYWRWGGGLAELGTFETVANGERQTVGTIDVAQRGFTEPKQWGGWPVRTEYWYKYPITVDWARVAGEKTKFWNAEGETLGLLYDGLSGGPLQLCEYEGSERGDCVTAQTKAREAGNLVNPTPGESVETSSDLAPYKYEKNRFYQGGDIVWTEYHSVDPNETDSTRKGRTKPLWYVSNYGYAECYGDECFCGGTEPIGYHLISANNADYGALSAESFVKCACFNIAVDDSVGGVNCQGQQIGSAQIEYQHSQTAISCGKSMSLLNNKSDLSSSGAKSDYCNAPIPPWSQIPNPFWERISDNYVEFVDTTTLENPEDLFPYPYHAGEIAMYREVPYELIARVTTTELGHDYTKIGSNTVRALPFGVNRVATRARHNRRTPELQIANQNSQLFRWAEFTEWRGRGSVGRSIYSSDVFSARGADQSGIVTVYDPYQSFDARNGRHMRNTYLSEEDSTNNLTHENAVSNFALKGIPVRVFAGQNSTYIYAIEKGGN